MTDPPIGRSAIFVDSSAFFAAASIRDSNHARASRIQARITGRGWRLVTTTYVIAELHALAMARLGPRLALDIIERIERGNVLIVGVRDEDWQHAWSILRRYRDKEFSFTDALSFAVMRRLDIQDAFAFDRHFVQYGMHVLDDAN